MGKLDLNLDAYRLIADLLHRLRQVIRQELRETHGPTWEQGIPDDLRMFLTQRRQREEGISWFKTDGVDLLDYANFADLAEVLAATPSLLQRLEWLPSTGREVMLKVRFLELDTVFQRVAFARPVSEMEMELLAGLGERIKKSLEGGPAGDRAGAAEPPGATPAPRAMTERLELKAPALRTTTPETIAVSPASPRAKDLSALQEALAQGDSKTVMRALYHEIVATADTIFKEGRGPSCPVWELVRESSWYEENFRRLALAPVSHFFDIVEDAKERSHSASREEVLEAARNRGFAQTLLQLKELFQPYLSER